MSKADTLPLAARGETSDSDGFISRRAWLLLAAITLAGAALRVYGLARWSLWYDEGTTMYAAGLAAAPQHLIDPEWLTEPPLLPILIYGWVHALAFFGVDLGPGTYRTDFLIRLVPCVFSIGAVPLGFAAARSLTRSTATGLLASLLIAIAPFQVYYAQELRPYATMTVFVVGALWCLGRALETDRAAHWGGVALLLALGMYNHFFTVWYIASFGLAVCLIAAKRRRISIKWIVSQAVLLLSILPALKQGLVVNDVVSHINTSWYPPISALTGLITIKTFFAGYSLNAPAYHTLFVLGAFLAGFGFWSLRRRAECAILLLVVAVVPIVANLVLWSLREFPYYEHRLFVACGAAFCIAVAAGILAVRSRGVRTVIIALWLVLTMPCLLDCYAQRIHPSERHRLGVRYKVDNRSVANCVREGLSAGDVVGHFSHVTLFPLRYHYLPDAQHVTLGFTDDDRNGTLGSYPHVSVWEHIGGLPNRIDSVASHGKRMWYVESWWEPFNPPPRAVMYRAWLNRHGVIAMEKEFFGVRLGLYDFAAMSNALARVEQIADSGDFSAPRYIDPSGETIGGPSNVPPGETPAFALERDTRSGAVTVRNDARGARALRCRLYACAEAIEPLAFNRAHPEWDVWRPVMHEDAAFFDDLDPIKLGAALVRGRHDEDAVYADVRLEAGAYRVLAYLWREAGATNTSRATLHFAFGHAGRENSAAELSREVTPSAVEGASGWAWHDVTPLVSDGGVLRVTVKASIPAELDRAFADLGRVVFVADAGGDERSEYLPLREIGVDVGPNESKAVEFGGAPARGGRFDVFVVDTKTRDLRRVNWYDGHEGP